ncbi:MAG: hypothetical protein ACK5SL_01875, partial [Cyclobacteriaceae bacterium]
MAEFPVRANTNQAEREIDQLIGVLRKLKQEGKLTEQEFNDLSASAKKFGTEGSKGVNAINKEMNNLSGVGKKAIGVLGTLFALDQIKQFITQVVQVTAEFQKFEAVLTNTLGSRSQAQIALRQIQDFAAKTPFSVQELTASFVKLANQGFKPTTEEMRKLGDLAASTGKQFDMLTEAIIDAQTGEFERLKEFGIRASKEGDNVTFTFKGVQTQVEFTSEAIRNYILALGDAEGVSGAMASISATLGGQISNLGDAFTQLLQQWGDSQSGPAKSIVQMLTLMLNDLKEITRTEEQLQALRQSDAQKNAVELLKNMAASTGDLEKAQGALVNMNNRKIDQLRVEKRELDITTDAGVERNNEIVNEIRVLNAANTAIDDYVVSINKETDAKNKAAEAARKKADAERDAAVIRRLQATQNAEEGDFSYISKYLDGPGVDPDLIKRLDQLTEGFVTGPQVPDADPGITADRAREESLGQLVNYSTMAFNEILRSRSVAVQQEMALLENQYRYELSLAGNNADARNAIQQRYDQQRRALMNRQAQVDQQNAIFGILVNQGPGIAKAISSAPPPLNFALGAAVAAYFALMLNNQRRIQAPRFKDGVFGLDGPGTETSDSILAMLSRNESVVPARKSRRFASVLKPMIEDDNFSMIDLKRIVDRSLPDFRLPVVMGMPGTDSKEVAEELRKTR